MREKSKIKIVLSLLIAVAFLLPTTAMASEIKSTEAVKASAGNTTLGQPELVTLKDLGLGLTPLDEDDGCFPVDVTAISVGGLDMESGDIIRTGTYPLDTTVCQTEFNPCLGMWTLYTIDNIQEGIGVPLRPLVPLEVYTMTDGTNMYFNFTVVGLNQGGDSEPVGNVSIYISFDNGVTYRTFTTTLADPTHLYEGATVVPCATVTRTGGWPVLPKGTPAKVVIKLPIAPTCCIDMVWWYTLYSSLTDTNYNWGSGWLESPFDGDIYPVTVKKFIDVYKLVEHPGEYTDDEVVDLYCEDFEDPCEINTNWATIDQPVWGANGALDTWTWSAKRYCSAGHSMHSTSFEQYLPNQLDILEMIVPVDVSAYDEVNVTFCMWIEGDAINIGNETVPVMLIQDYGYFEYSFDAVTWIQPDGLYYDSNGVTQTIGFDILLDDGSALDDSIFVRFVWYADAAFCFEGMYIDDVCFTGTIYGETITEPWDEWVWIHDSYDGPLTFNTECINNVFPDVWTVTEEGTYMICAWLEAIDECHFSSTPVDDPYCIVIEIGNILDNELDCTTLDITPPSPAWEGDDITSTIEVCNVGTLDETNKQIQMTVNRGTFESFFHTGFEGMVNEDDGAGNMILEKWEPGPPEVPYSDEWVTNWNPYPRSYWHYSTYDSSEGSQAIANFYWDETSAQPWSPSTTGTSDYVRGPDLWKGSDKDSGITATFDYKINAGANEYLRFGVWDWTIGSGYFYSLTAYTGGNYYLDWNTVSYDASSLIASCMGVTGAALSDDCSFGFIYQKNAVAGDGAPGCPWGSEWSGVMIDNLNYESLVAGTEVIFQETQVLPFLNISDCATLTFEWPDAGVGQYVFTYEIITPDSNADNNKCITPYNIINTIECVEDWECVDYTGPGAGHWVEESCCGGYFWPGDSVTTMYGNNWNDALYLKNATGGLNFNLLGGAVSIDFDTWFQISVNDFGSVEYSNDGGNVWWPLASYTGTSVGDPFGWFHPTLAVPGTGTATMQFRFVFKSNATGVNRGWFVDNIRVTNGVTTVFGPDPCLDFTKFYRHEVQFGCWWQQPWIETYAYLNGDLATMAYNQTALPHHLIPVNWVYAGLEDYFEPSWGVYDPGIFTGTYGTYNVRPWLGAYPDNLNTAIIGTIDIPHAFYGALSATLYYDYIDAGDQGYLEVSTDGVTWDVLAAPTGDYYYTATGGLHASLDGKLRNDYVYWDSTPAALGGSPATYDLSDYMDATQIQVRARFTSDAQNLWREAGFGLLGPVCFTGMSDNNAPVTTLQMSGTFDETYHYYTSSVKMKLTATDDITGVAHTYYKLDGVTSEYTGLVTINTDGEHTFCYWSVDNEGNVEAEKCVAPFFIDLTGPSVTITGPATGYLYLFGNQLLPLKSGKTIFLFGGIPVTATATADEAPIQVVRFYLDDVLLAEDTTAPYGATLSAKHSGPAVIKVTATDVLGHEASDTLNIDNYFKLI